MLVWPRADGMCGTCVNVAMEIAALRAIDTYDSEREGWKLAVGEEELVIPAIEVWSHDAVRIVILKVYRSNNRWIVSLHML